MLISMDIESRSVSNLKSVGAYAYAAHPSTQFICLAWKLDDGPTMAQDFSTPMSVDFYLLLDHLRAGAKVAAFNAAFERTMWNTCLHFRAFADGVLLDVRQMQCTMAKALMAGLPGSLEQAAKAIGSSVLKDHEGSRLMLKMCRPDKKGGWVDSPEQRTRLMQYCKTDVDTEWAVSRLLPEIPAGEMSLWRLTERINDTGVFADIDTTIKAKRLMEQYAAEVDAECKSLTGLSGRQTVALRKSLEDSGLKMLSLNKKSVETALKDETIDPIARRVLELRQESSKASTAKLGRILDMAGTDGRIRGNLIWHGASTGRFCIPEEYSILTELGWERPKTGIRGITLAEWQENGSIQFKPIKRINVFPFSGNLLNISNGLVDISCTEEHSFPCFSSRNKLSTRQASSKFSGVKIPLAGIYEPNTPVPEIITRILVMVQADGHYSLTNGRALKLGFKKERKIERCKKLLYEAGIAYHTQYPASGSSVFYVAYKDIPEWLWNFKDKQFGPWLLNHSPEVFMDEIPLWDGHRQKGLKSFEYSSTSLNNAEWVQIMSSLSAMPARVLHPGLRDASWAESHRVFSRPNKSVRVNADHWGEKSYGGNVFCPETESGFFVCRADNGTVFISGNSGRGVQVQNFPRPTVSDLDNTIIECIQQDSLELLKLLYASPAEAVSSALRGLLMAPPHGKLCWADFNAIECRMLAYLAGDKKTLDMFRNGIDPYKIMASKIYHVPTTSVTKDQRGLGKVSVLSCGYQIGHKGFRETCTNYNIDISEADAKRVVAIYRDNNPEVVEMWGELEEMCVDAVTNPGRKFTSHRMEAISRDGFLTIKLISGRSLYFHRPFMKAKKTPWGEMKDVIHYTGTYQNRPSIESLYGGSITAMCTQGTARDIMTDAMLALDREGFTIVLSVHDEVVCENDPTRASELTRIMETTPSWAAGLPLRVETIERCRYGK